MQTIELAGETLPDRWPNDAKLKRLFGKLCPGSKPHSKMVLQQAEIKIKKSARTSIGQPNMELAVYQSLSQRVF